MDCGCLSPQRRLYPGSILSLPGCLREGAKSYVKQVNHQRRGASTAVQEARTFRPCSRNWPCGPTYL